MHAGGMPAAPTSSGLKQVGLSVVALPVHVPIRVSRLVLPVLGALRYMVRYAWLTRMRQYGKSGGGRPTRAAEASGGALVQEGMLRLMQQPGGAMGGASAVQAVVADSARRELKPSPSA